jgi:Domain of unknown function (DUF5753)
MEWSLSKVIRIESGIVGISGNDLRALLHLYGISDRSGELLDLARASRQSSSWGMYRGAISAPDLRYIEHEEVASALRIYAPLLLPGLLQTPQYATAIIRLLADPGTPEYLIQNRIKIVMRRQERMTAGSAPVIVCILDESAVQHTVGQRDVAPGQIARLIDLSSRPNVTLKIIPFSAGFHNGMVLEPFRIASFPDPEDGEVIFSGTSRDTIDSHHEIDEITRYQELFWQLEAVSLSAEETLAYLKEIADRIVE